MIDLSEEAKVRLKFDIKSFYFDEFDEEVSDFKAERLFDFFSEKFCAPIYNQAIQDARAFMMNKLDDLEGDLYMPIKDDVNKIRPGSN